MLPLLAAAALATGHLYARERNLFDARVARRARVFGEAQEQARILGRPLVVVGDPYAGLPHDGTYGCGDVTVDLTGCPRCPRGVRADICSPGAIPLPDDSAVVFLACVLEYVEDCAAASRELHRVAGDGARLHIVGIDPGSFTAATWQGARRVLTSTRPLRWRDFSPPDRVLVQSRLNP